jgi:hypothetical protein
MAVDQGEAMMGRVLGLTVLGTLTLMVALAVAGVVDAEASTYCVNDPACPTGGLAKPDLQTALSFAAASMATVDKRDKVKGCEKVKRARK